MTDKPSNPKSSGSDTDLPEVWSDLEERLDSTSTGSRYLVSKGEQATAGEAEDLLDAHDVALNRSVSLKQLAADEVDDAVKHEAFVKEARLTGNLQHPNIIPVHDLTSTDDGSLYFTLRHVDGKKLGVLLVDSEDPLTLNEGITIFNKICDAIAFAHSLGTYHTALSVEAIIIGNHGEVFVVNWGKAVKSTPHDRDHVHQDLNALGTILQIITRWSTIDGKLPLSLEAIITRANAPIRLSYASVDALREDIGRFQAGLPTLAEEASVVRQLVLLARRHKMEASFLLVAIIVAGIMGVWFIQNIRLERDRALKEADVEEMASETAIRHAQKEQAYLDDLKRLVPMLMQQIDVDMASGRFVEARERADIALELTQDDPDWALWERYGDVLQALLLFEEATAAYARIPLTDANRERITRKIAISHRYEGKLTTDNASDNTMMKLYLDMVAMGRKYEANRIITKFQKRQVSVLADLRLRLTKNSQQLEYLNVPLTPQTRIATRIGAGRLAVRWTADSKYRVTNFDDVEAIPFTDLECEKGNDVDSLDALRGKPLLTLKLLDTTVSDLGPLSDLPLTDLRILSSTVSSLEPLRTVPLKTLEIRNSPFASLAPLSGLQLTSLDISGSQVSNLSPLASQQLESLTVARTPVKTLEGIDVSRLTSLSVNQTGLATLDSLKHAKLVNLNAASTPISDLTPLAGNPLEVVNISRTKVASLVPLQECPLTELIVAESAVTSLAPVANATSLKQLDISGLQITEIPQNDWNRLERFDAGGSAITSVAALQGRPLRVVDVSDTPVADISPVVSRFLHTLNVRNTKVTDLTPLAGSNVKILKVSGTPIHDLSPLSTVYLSSLDISNTPVTTLKGIEKLPLDTLDIRNTKVTDLSLLKHSPLKEIHLGREQYRQGADILRSMPFLKTCVVDGEVSNPKVHRR